MEIFDIYNKVYQVVFSLYMNKYTGIKRGFDFIKIL